jgi:hypothetical protein
LLVYYGVATIYPPPKLQYSAIDVTPLPPNATPEEREKYKDQQEQRQGERRKLKEAHDIAAKDFARHLVIISTPLGVAAILIGAYISLYAIGTGLIFGGIFSVGAGYWGYWTYLDDWVRFVSLLAGFLILLFVGYFRVSRPATP